jgi:hypothetical protein
VPISTGSSGQRDHISTVTTTLRVESRSEPEAEAGLLEDMIRAASRNSSRPASAAADSRPESRLDSRAESRAGSRAGKMSRKAFGVDPDSIEEPDRDSPVLTPRARRLEKERRAASLGLSPPKHLPAREISNQTDYHPAMAASNPPSAPSDKYIVTSLQSFDQIAVKKSKQEKVSKLLARQKRKAEKLARKKYRGFGQPATTEGDKITVKKEVKQERMRQLKLSAARHSHLTQEESDLIASLLLDAESAVLQSHVPVAEDKPQKAAVSSTENLILDFEESQTLSESQAHTEEPDFLYGL